MHKGHGEHRRLDMRPNETAAARIASFFGLPIVESTVLATSECVTPAPSASVLAVVWMGRTRWVPFRPRYGGFTMTGESVDEIDGAKGDDDGDLPQLADASVEDSSGVQKRKRKKRRTPRRLAQVCVGLM